MKRINTYILAALTAIAAAVPAAYAQERDAATQEEIDSLRQQIEQTNQEINRQKLDLKYNQIWKKGRYTMLGYALQDMRTDQSPTLDSKWSFFLAKGTTYYFPKRPLWGLVKIGLDMRWTDISISRHNAGGITSDNWDPTGTGYGDYDDEEEDPGFMDNLGNLGRYNLQVSAFGVGVNVGVAPLSMLDNAARYLRACVYFHYLPTFGAVLISEDGETEASYGYCNMFDFGGRITYRAISVGIEGRWGSGRFKALGFDFSGDSDDGLSGDPEKITRKFSATRFYVAFTF